jgi:hypothetical protein
MKHHMLPVGLLLSTVVLPVSTGSAAERSVSVGSRIESLTFKDIHYLQRTLDDFANRKAFVLVFTSSSCPLAQRYMPTLRRLEKDYRDRGVQLLALNAAPEDGIGAVAAQAVQYEMEFPFVKDFEGACARALGVERTPEVALLDADRRLRYRGRIDDQYRLGGVRPAPMKHDLKDALDAVLAGREVTIKETPVDGCLITFPESPKTKPTVTYTEHIAPLLRTHCQVCHRPGTIAPFSLLTYQQVSARAKTIAEVVRDQRMPPWYAADSTEFINHRGLTAEERERVQEWARAGKPQGDPAREPASLPPAESKWQIGDPDLVLEAPVHELPAAGDIAYKYVVLPHAFEHDTWVQGVQIRPDNPRVVHHCNLAFGTLGEGFKGANFITGTVPGGEAMNLQDDIGFRIPKGAMLALQIHYVTTGKPEKCRLAVGLRYARGTVQKQLRFTLLVDTRFAIPPGAPAHPVINSKVLDRDALGIGLFSHMHLRGKDMTFRAHYPDGKSETLLLIPNYSFNWQMPYRWAFGKKALPKGTRLECIAHYDNSDFNPYNPDPKATVRDGPQTYQEMMNGFVFWVDAQEKLDLSIDPKTGQAQAKPK